MPPNLFKLKTERLCRFPGLWPSCQRPQKLAPVHPILECLAPIDKHHGHLIVVLRAQFVVGVDVDFAPLEISIALELNERFLDDVAQVTSLARINYYFVHSVILNAREKVR